MERTDEELIADYLGGEENAFEELTGRYLQTVYSFIYRLIGNADEAQDIAQEVFLRAWKKIGTYNSDTSRFKTWVLRIARNASIDYLRKKKHIALSKFEDTEGNNVLTDTLADEAALPEELFAKEEDAEMLAQVVMELSPAQREILTLHYTNHLTFEEIAQALDEPQNTVKSRHHRALLNLRKLLSFHAPNIRP